MAANAAFILRSPALLQFTSVPTCTYCPLITFARYKTVRDSGHNPKSRTNYFNFKAEGFPQPCPRHDITFALAAANAAFVLRSPAACRRFHSGASRYITGAALRRLTPPLRSLRGFWAYLRRCPLIQRCSKRQAASGLPQASASKYHRLRGYQCDNRRRFRLF